MEAKYLPIMSMLSERPLFYIYGDVDVLCELFLCDIGFSHCLSRSSDKHGQFTCVLFAKQALYAFLNMSERASVYIHMLIRRVHIFSGSRAR